MISSINHLPKYPMFMKCVISTVVWWVGNRLQINSYVHKQQRPLANENALYRVAVLPAGTSSTYELISDPGESRTKSPPPWQNPSRHNPRTKSSSRRRQACRNVSWRT